MKGERARLVDGRLTGKKKASSFLELVFHRLAPLIEFVYSHGTKEACLIFVRNASHCETEASRIRSASRRQSTSKRKNECSTTRFLFASSSRSSSLAPFSPHSRDDPALPQRAQGHACEHQLQGRGGDPRHLGVEKEEKEGRRIL